MSSKGKKEVIKLNALPRGLEEMLQVYGDPDRTVTGDLIPTGGKRTWSSATCRSP